MTDGAGELGDVADGQPAATQDRGGGEGLAGAPRSMISYDMIQYNMI